MSNGPKNFWALFAEALELSASQRSFRAFIPWWLFITAICPVIAGYMFSWCFRGIITDATAAQILASIAVVAGFLGSVSIATATQVQKMASEYPFSSYLRDEKIYDTFFFWPQFTLLLQITLIVLATFSAITIRLINLGQFNNLIVLFNAGLLFYICTKTWKLVELVRTLSWHYEDYTRQLAEYKRSQEQTK